MKRLLALLAIALMPTLAVGADFPSRPVTIVVPFAPGGANDLIARMISQQALNTLGQPVIVDNRAGAAGAIGTDLVAEAAPDGYTLLMASGSSLTMSPALQKTPLYDPINDFKPVLLVGEAPQFVVASANLPANSIQELIDLAKGKPDDYSFGSSGIGSSPHLAGEMLCNLANIKMLHIPYKGASESVTALISGETDINIFGLTNAAPALESGKAKLLAVTTASRTKFKPDVPTLLEAGVPGFEFSAWFAVMAPKGTPDDVVVKLRDSFTTALAGPQVDASFEKMGVERLSKSLEETEAFIVHDVERWKKVVSDANLEKQ